MPWRSDSAIGRLCFCASELNFRCRLISTHNIITAHLCARLVSQMVDCWHPAPSSDSRSQGERILPKNNSLSLEIGRVPKRKDRLPTIHFQWLGLLVSGSVISSTLSGHVSMNRFNNTVDGRNPAPPGIKKPCK